MLWGEQDVDLTIELYALWEWWDQRFPGLRVKDEDEIPPDQGYEGLDDEGLDVLPVRFQRLQQLGVPIEDIIHSGLDEPVIGEMRFRPAKWAIRWTSGWFLSCSKR